MWKKRNKTIQTSNIKVTVTTAHYIATLNDIEDKGYVSRIGASLARAKFCVLSQERQNEKAKKRL